MISVVIPLYNKEEQIENTLHSIMKQSYQNFEVVIVDDGSIDGSFIRVLHFLEARGLQKDEISLNHWVTLDGRFTLIKQPNGGVSNARNRGVYESQYDYIAFIDADDCWKPNYLENALRLIKKYGDTCDVFASAYSFVSAKGESSKLILNRLPFEGDDGILSNYFEVASCSHPPIWSSSVVVAKEALISVGCFPEGVISGEDLLTWAKLAAQYNIAYSLLPLVEFYVPERVDLKPKRTPDPENRVGNELISLWTENPIPGLKAYIGRWFEMRASVYLRLGMNRSAFEATLKSMQFCFKKKHLIYILLILLPVSVRLKIFSKK